MINSRNISEYLKRITPLNFLAFLLLFTLLRNGLSIYGERYRNFAASDRQWSFELSLTNDPVRRLFEAIGFFVGPAFFSLFYLGFLFCGFLLILLEIRSYSTTQKKVFLVFLSLLPGITIILNRLGTFDSVSFVFAVLSAMTKNGKRKFSYLLVLMFSHIESTLVIAIVFVIISSMKLFKNSFEIIFGSRRPFILLFLISAILSFLNGISGDSRASQLFPLLKLSIAQALSSGYWLPYSWFGGTLLTLLYALNRISVRESIMMSLIFVSLGLFSIITADGTRVAMLVLTLPMVSFFMYILNKGYVKSTFLILGFLFPAINVSNLNVYLPFRQIAYLFGLDLTFIST